ncbi:hypothetical protein, partial [Roseicitreum antarcticum]|uniref:hypothetical protein n=1 Tax=Roseicitreum antarcticum TaxID=564137 RepID=UPI001C40A599
MPSAAAIAAISVFSAMSDISYPSPTVTISEASLSEFSTEGVFIGSYDGPGRGDIENNFEEYLARLFANS